MVRECSAIELRARLALLAAPCGVLAEGAVAKAMGKTTRSVRGALLASLEAEAAVSIEPARRGRRIRLTERGRAVLGELRVPARARLSGSVVNALLERLSRAEASAPAPSLRTGALRERVLAAHATLAHGPGRTVELVALRAALPDFPKTDIDRVLLELDREGVVALGRAVDLATLDARVRSAAIEDAHRGTLVYVSRAEPSHASVEARP